MDPNATLKDLLEAIHDGDSTVAREMACHLRDWLATGGFAPTNVSRYVLPCGTAIYGVKAGES